MPKKILLADDSITIQKVVELTFSDADYEVTAVNNGAKAIAKLAEMRPDIILSDIIMPEKNGYEVCEYVKSHPEYRSIPVLAAECGAKCSKFSRLSTQRPRPAGR